MLRQVLTVFVGLALVAGCKEAAAPTAAPPPKVSIQHPQTRLVADYDSYNGWMEAPETVEVRARVRGHIEKVHFTDGEIVKKGDLLFELDPRPFQQEIDRSIEQVEIYQSQLNYALVEEKRLKEMRTDQVASAIEVESAEAKVKSLAAQVEAQKKEVERDRLELEYARITAPIAGRIGRAMLTEGNLVNAGGSDPLLTTIVRINPISIYFSVDERALQRYAKLRPATTQPRDGVLRDLKITFLFGLETEDGYPHEAILDFADNVVNRETGTIVARGEVSNDDGFFVPGSRVRIRLPIGEPSEVVLIPDTAILTDQDKKYVLVLDDQNVVQRRDVKLGRLMDDGMRTILAGPDGQSLGTDDRVVVLGLQMARINYPADPVEPTTQPVQSASVRD